jgi:CoA:oxalate CoA-transferase
MVLADLGARVIKIETPDGGDDSRRYGPFVNGKSAYFMAMNRGKESIALDLKLDSDRTIFERLLEEADVLVENFRPGAMERLGYGWEALHARHPRLIYAAASGFGHSGPYASKPAYDMVVQGMGGIMSITGHPGGPPTRVGASIGDITAGLFTAIGIASALHHRHASGEGMKVDVAMLDCQVAILENALSRYFLTNRSPQPLGARHPRSAPFAAFATADGHVIIAAGTDALFKAAAASRPELARVLVPQQRPAFGKCRCPAAVLEMSSGRAAQIADAARGGRRACGPINDIAGVANDLNPRPQHDRRHRGSGRAAEARRQSDQAVGLPRSDEPTRGAGPRRL